MNGSGAAALVLLRKKTPITPVSASQTQTAQTMNPTNYAQPFPLPLTLAGAPAGSQFAMLEGATAAIDLSERSPYALNPVALGFPPPSFNDLAMIRYAADEKISIAGAPISTQISAKTLMSDPVAPTEGTGQYGRDAILPIALAAGVPMRVLARPSSRRVLLRIMNLQAAGGANVTYNFDKPAGPGSMPIPPGGNTFYSTAVPQSEVWCFCAVAANILVEYIDIHAQDQGYS